MIHSYSEREFLALQFPSETRKTVTPAGVTFRPGLVLLLLLFLASVPSYCSAQDTSADEFTLFDEPATNNQAVARAVEILGPRYQTELPEVEEVLVVQIPPARLPDIFSKIAMVLGAIIIVVLVFNLFYSPGRFDSLTGDRFDTQGDIDFSRLKVPDPDRLAAAGQFAEAIHALLLRSLVLIARRLGSSWPRSLTSREILRHGKLPAEASLQLGQLVQRVEVHHFGGLEPAATDYTRCHEIYEKLADGLKGGST